MPRLIFLCGTQGVGKTTLAHSWSQAGENRLHIEVDQVRKLAKLESPKMSATCTEDVVNWRVYYMAMKALRAGITVCIDSTGASRRYGFLRQALSDFPQVCVKLYASDPCGVARRKWPRMGEDEVLFYSRSIDGLRVDCEILVDGQTAGNVLQIFTQYISKTPTL